MKNKKIIIVSSVIILLIAIVVAIILITKPFNKKNENNQNQEENNISKEQIYNGQPIDIVYIQIKDASDNLGKIIGKNISSDIINKIFEKFCLGK